MFKLIIIEISRYTDSKLYSRYLKWFSENRMFSYAKLDPFKISFIMTLSHVFIVDLMGTYVHMWTLHSHTQDRTSNNNCYNKTKRISSISNLKISFTLRIAYRSLPKKCQVWSRDFNDNNQKKYRAYLKQLQTELSLISLIVFRIIITVFS